jgi:8-oxo-dGTP diphosphatase
MHLNEHDAAAWLTKEKLYSVQWLPADEGILEKIEALIS